MKISWYVANADLPTMGPLSSSNLQANLVSYVHIERDLGSVGANHSSSLAPTTTGCARGPDMFRGVLRGIITDIL
jgi:hypothetical protein